MRSARTAIEIGLEMASVHREATDLPPGPDTDASTASPQLAEQKAEVKETDLPKDKPTETEEADRVVTETSRKSPRRTIQRSRRCRPRPRPNRSRPKPPRCRVPKPFRRGRVRSRRRSAAARPRAACARPGRRNWSPISTSTSDIRAERSQKTAEIMVSFALDRMGHVYFGQHREGIRRSRRSTRPPLAMVRRSDPVPAPPPLVADEGLSFTLPVIFRRQGQELTAERAAEPNKSVCQLNPPNELTPAIASRCQLQGRP